MSKINGNVWKYGDDVNTDVIFAGKYTYTITDRKEMAKHALEDLDPTFAKNVKKGDIIVAGSNFGCGSSREQAATCLVEAGIGAIVAESFARIFFRNALNEGLPLITCKDAIPHIKKESKVEIDLEKGVMTVDGKPFTFPGLAPEIVGILNEGGLIPYLKKKLASQKTA